MKYIVIKNLYHTYDKKKDYVLKNINLEIEKGETVVVLGSSGVGKSTLLRCINRLIEPTSGEILIHGENILQQPPRKVREIRQNIGMVFQEFNLINRIKVIDAVLAGRLSYNKALRNYFSAFKSSDYEMALDSLKRVGMEKYAYEKVGNLSGGEKQRVGIARALTQNPKIILADEPVSNLDARLMVDVMDLLKNICERDGITLISNLHFIQLAKKYADRIIGIRGGEIVVNTAPSELTEDKIIKIYGKTKEWELYGRMGF